MDEALRILLKEIHSDIKEIKVDVKAQNGRVRKLEINQAKLIGAIVVISTIASFAMKYFLG